jgi:hypothetical protein
MSEEPTSYKANQLATRNIDPAPLATAAQSLGPEIERVLVGGDLSKLNADQRVSYVQAICKSMGMNPLTRPFDYVTLQGKLTLYARKDATEQLRLLRGVSVTDMKREQMGDLLICTCHVATPDGRTDQATGAVNVAGLRGEALANAFMKVETKAKRRATLSIVGLGFMDESEFQTTEAAPEDGSEPAQANGPKAGTRKMFPKKEAPAAEPAPEKKPEPKPAAKPEPEIQDAEIVEPKPEPAAEAEFQPTQEQEALAKHRKPYLEGIWKDYALEDGKTIGELDKNAKNKLIVTVQPDAVELRGAIDAMMIDVLAQQAAKAGSNLADYAKAQGWTPPLFASSIELTKMITHFRQQAAQA